MAIEASIQTQFGIPASYWRLLYQINDFRGDGVTVVVAGYASADARRDGKEPLAVLQDIRLPGVKASDEPSRAALYQALGAHAAALPLDHPHAVLIPLASGVAA